MTIYPPTEQIPKSDMISENEKLTRKVFDKGDKCPSQIPKIKIKWKSSWYLLQTAFCYTVWAIKFM